MAPSERDLRSVERALKDMAAAMPHAGARADATARDATPGETAPDDAAVAGSTSDVFARVQHPLRILVIDDEPMIGMTVKDAFSDDLVETFIEPTLALKRVEEVTFDIVLCDFMMPSMTGVEVHRALLQSAPDLALHFVLMTGSAQTEAIADFLNAYPIFYLQKPFRLKELMRCVAGAALRAHQAPSR